MSPTVRRSLAPRGRTPVLKQKGGSREKVSVIAALTLAPRRRRLGLYYRTYPKGYVDNVKAADFIRRLLRQLPGKVIVIWDGGPMHKGDPIRELLGRTRRLTLERLPPYAPDLNPVEQLWNYLKYTELPNFAPEDAIHLDGVLLGHLQAARQDPGRLRSFFEISDLPFPRKALAA